MKSNFYIMRVVGINNNIAANNSISGEAHLVSSVDSWNFSDYIIQGTHDRAIPQEEKRTTD